MLDVEVAKDAAMEAAMASPESIAHGIDASGNHEELKPHDDWGKTNRQLTAAGEDDDAMSPRRSGPSFASNRLKVPEAHVLH